MNLLSTIERVQTPRLVCERLRMEHVPETNAASRRVLEKTGFQYERDFVHADLLHVLYRRRADGDAPEHAE